MTDEMPMQPMGEQPGMENSGMGMPSDMPEERRTTRKASTRKRSTRKTSARKT